jgi:hypothetical protein
MAIREMLGRAALAVLAVMTAAETVGAADWPQYRADATRSGYTAGGLAPDLRLAWSYRLPYVPMPAWPDPGWERNRLAFDLADHVVAADGQVFFGSSADGRSARWMLGPVGSGGSLSQADLSGSPQPYGETACWWPATTDRCIV